MNPFALFMLLFCVLFASWCLTFVSRRVAIHRRILDIPNERSSHSIPTPRGGGYSFVLMFLATATALGAMHLLQPLEMLAILAGAGVAAVGGWDDYAGLPVRVRLPVHVLAAATAVLSLVHLHSLKLLLGLRVLAFGIALLACLVLVWLTNLTNFMDGIDGLAGMEAVTVAAVCCVISTTAHGFNIVAFLFVVLSAAAGGFLLWNWHPARIFMGDVGSGFLGYCFGCLALLGIARHALSPFVPVILLGTFIVDATYTLLRRVSQRKRWYEAHRSHAYQHVARRYGHKWTTLLTGCINLFWLGPWAAYAQWHPTSAVICLVCAWVPLVLAVQWVGAGETTGRFETLGSDLALSVQVRSPLRRRVALKCAILTRSLFQIMEKHGFAVKHVTLAVVNFCCVLLALLTRFDGVLPRTLHAAQVAIVWATAQGVVLLFFRISRSHWRFTSAEEIPGLAAIAVSASLVGAASANILSQLAFVHPISLPHSVYPLDAFYSVVALAAIRVGSRSLHIQSHRWARENARTRVLIYGADDAGVGVLSELRRHCFDYRAVGFVEERAEAHGATLSGVPVLGGIQDISRLAKRFRVDLVLVPSANQSSTEEQAVVQVCLEERLNVRVVRTMNDEISLRRPRLTPELVIEDLLGRKPVQLDISKIAHKLSGQVVMVTGAAGSIGSELCRQIARFGPRAILGYEINETALFFMERQMQELFPSISFIPCIGSVQNRARLEDVLKTYRPETVYHAAAYKHVPLMEQHIFEAIENNIFGTETLLRACHEHGVSSFVMISTDKAARPTSLMGATKRVAEMLVRATTSPHLTCVSTRFGNVLGSNGSVIPIFREQITKGGPVKVTHPAMVRFFMTIPEAAQLVLQASCLGSANEIFVLDMGAPVKIVDLAEKMIRLAGLIPGEDISIEFTGMRPGEKLYEELSTSDEELMPTAHKSVSVFRSDSNASAQELGIELDKLRDALDRRSAQEALRIIERIVPDYTASKQIRELSEPLYELTGTALHVA